MNRNLLIHCQNLSKSYEEAGHSIKVLDQVYCTIQAGEQVAIMGRSGSGKSTLLQLLAGLDRPTQGEIFFEDRSLHALNEQALEQFRNRSLGFIYQAHHLLAELTALENVMMPLLIANQSVQAASTQAKQCLKDVGLAARATHKPSQLSGGERQRVAIARALVHQPTCLLADEPTGNLDDETAAEVFEILQTLNRQKGSTLIMVTHDVRLATQMDRSYLLHAGHLSDS